MIIKQKKCKVCPNLFTPYRSTDNCCSPKCFYEYSKNRLTKAVKSFKQDLKKITTRSSHTGAIRKLDQLWSKIVRLRYKNKCALCQLKSTSAHHIFTKGAFPHMRYVIENGIGLCDGHHTKGYFSAHLNPIYFKERLIQIIGLPEYEKLLIMAHTSIDTKVDREEVYLKLKQVYNAMKKADNKEV